MEAFYASSNNQRDTAPMLYVREHLPNSSVLPGNMMMYMNSGSYSDALAGNSQQQNNCMVIPSLGASNSAQQQQEILSNFGSRIVEHDFNAWREGRNEMLVTHAMGGSTSILHGGQNLQGQGLSLSLSTQIPTGIQMPSIPYRNPNPGFASILSPSSSVSADSGDRNGSSRDEQLRNAEYLPHSFPGGNQDLYKGHLSTLGMPHIVRNIPNSKYLKAAQQLLDEVVNIRKALKQPDIAKHDGAHEHQIKSRKEGGGGTKNETTMPPSGVSSYPHESASNSLCELSHAEKQDLQDKLTKLLSMSDEVDRRYKQYYHQMQIVVSSFDVIAGCGAAKPYTALALQTISRHFRCLRDAITGQIRATRKSLGVGDEQSSLLQLKNKLVFDGALSAKLVHWNDSADCCSWEGVTCSEGRVIGLDLSNESISGVLDNSSSLFNLQHLQELNLAYNEFDSSQIPSQFTKLSNLTYLNLSTAGFAGQIPLEISHLKRLATLDLSILSYRSTYLLMLEKPNLSTLVQNLSGLRELHLDGVIISAKGYEWCQALSSSLPRLRVLSMSKCYLSGPFDPSLQNLQSLSVINLAHNQFFVPVPEFFADFKNLTSLSFTSSNLNGKFPEKIFQIPTLQRLQLSGNPMLQGSLSEFPRNGNLRTLVLGGTFFSGTLPDSIGNLKMLTTVDLNSCNFSGSIPKSMATLTQLVFLDMSYNNFTGPIPSFSMAKRLTEIYLTHNDLTGKITSTQWKELLNLKNLDLRYNSLEGGLPISLFSLPLLLELQLSNNRFSGQLDEFPNISSHPLYILDLSNNNLEGPIPMSIFELRGLKVLYLSSNNFNGSMQLDSIQQLKNLSNLDLSFNNLLIEHNGINSLVSLFPQISTLKLSSNILKTFPDFLRSQSLLLELDLSHNQIQGEIPSWIWKLPNLARLNLSFNYLVSLEGPFLSCPTLNMLDLRSNRLHGQFPVFLPNVVYLDLSRNNFNSSIQKSIENLPNTTNFFSLSSNKFNGSIPVSICNVTYLQVLDLSNNSFNGIIPRCLIEMSEMLGVLNLGRNNLSGTISDAFSSNCHLQTLALNENQLEGELPKSLANCTMLKVLHIGNNHIEDNFPCYLKNSFSLRVLVLRSNKFYGSIGCPGPNATWPDLQILDLAFNKFSGKLSKSSFTAWKTMIAGDDEEQTKLNYLQFDFYGLGPYYYYQDTLKIVSKGLEQQFVKIPTILNCIDFSYNNLVGPIPEELGELKLLNVLNLSNNVFTGLIPSSLGKLSHLESLDLSSNELTGEIPLQLADGLIFLSVLNLSFNQLFGRIPLIKQFATFSETSYEGNQRLCGFPLKEKCEPLPLPPTFGETPSDSRIVINWNYLSIELGYVFGFGIFIGPLMFWKRWRIWYFIKVDGILFKIFPKLYLGRKIQHRPTQRNRGQRCRQSF